VFWTISIPLPSWSEGEHRRDAWPDQELTDVHAGRGQGRVQRSGVIGGESDTALTTGG
jgi:hypothetical protein